MLLLKKAQIEKLKLKKTQRKKVFLFLNILMEIYLVKFQKLD